jgi:hypothetical protein
LSATIQVSEPVVWSNEPTPWTTLAPSEPVIDTSGSVF